MEQYKHNIRHLRVSFSMSKFQRFPLPIFSLQTAILEANHLLSPLARLRSEHECSLVIPGQPSYTVLARLRFFCTADIMSLN